MRTCNRTLGAHHCTRPTHDRETWCRDETPGRMRATWILSAAAWADTTPAHRSSPGR